MQTIDIVKDYIQKNMPNFIGLPIQIDDHNGSHDAHFVPLLDDVEHSDISNNDYQVATISKTITMDDGVQIPKIIKLTVKNNQVEKVTESK